MAPPTPLTASPELLGLLSHLHSASLDQESKLDWNQIRGESDKTFDAIMRDKYIALDQDKCELIYHLLRGTGATRIVEAGTSFGVSTIYLALAAAQNATGSTKGLVVATEKEETKAAAARSNWAQAGEEISGVIELRVGDLRETLASGLGEVDFLLLDSKLWTRSSCDRSLRDLINTSSFAYRGNIFVPNSFNGESEFTL
ncbi:hypothetical protein N7468_007166 [Penicillium chermesinum]|uniref:O-methyltransferase n=1 Tax=Penicillium chermesinum TaxID=63820 RepID=A0A9W9NUB5_9EURO|nr:uncharacterized protein N7468_007166 [Penicillium chermesinum]KAJ5225941.1 hypothetical protein N7468_007166 [Penicillium chermesinum]KAJ6160855.1 hypothetical protein N7470_004251 [Penicillium chermesinum]